MKWIYIYIYEEKGYGFSKGGSGRKVVGFGSNGV